jgi:hypothetical protein
MRRLVEVPLPIEADRLSNRCLLLSDLGACGLISAHRAAVMDGGDSSKSNDDAARHIHDRGNSFL